MKNLIDNFFDVDGATATEQIESLQAKAEAQRVRELLRQYHEYVSEVFPITGFGEASINNFLPVPAWYGKGKS